jgi:hypothetical protein
MATTPKQNRRYGALKSVAAIAAALLSIAFTGVPSSAQSHGDSSKKNDGKQKPPIKFILGPIVQTPDNNQGKGGGKQGSGSHDGTGQGTRH